MFVQKLELDRDQSYSTTTTVDNLVENLHLTFNHVVVLTPYLSTADSPEIVLGNLKRQRSQSRLTPTQFLEFGSKDKFDCTHLLVADHSLMEKFGFDLSTIEHPMIVLDENCSFQRVILSKFFIKNDESGSFVTLFILTKMFTGTVVTRRVRKTKMLFDIFGIEWNVISYDDLNGSGNPALVNRDCMVFMDGYFEICSERIFVLGAKRPSGTSIMEELKIDLSLAGKFKYRVEDVLRALSPAVVSGMRHLDPSRFRDIGKD